MESKGKSIAMLLLLALTIASCKKVEKILPKDGGVWEVTEVTTTEFVGGTQITQNTDTDRPPNLHF